VTFSWDGSRKVIGFEPHVVTSIQQYLSVRSCFPALPCISLPLMLCCALCVLAPRVSLFLFRQGLWTWLLAPSPVVYSVLPSPQHLAAHSVSH